MHPENAQTGTVKRFFEDKGYGFIKPQDGGPDIFFHHSALPGIHSISEGQRVSFNIKKDIKGRKAIDIKVID